MAQNICYHSKREEKEHSKEVVDQSKIKNQLSKLYTLYLYVLTSKYSSDPQFFSALLKPAHFILLG